MSSEETILDIDSIDQYCIDGGECKHDCNGDCFREKFDKPLPNSGFNEDWTPEDIKGIRER